MPRKPVPETNRDMRFPLMGIDVSMAYTQQRPQTTPSGINVRAYDPLTNRARGAQRAGLSKYTPNQVSGVNFTQELFTLVGTGYPPPGGSMQTSSSGRIVTLVAVAGGNIFALSPGQTNWVPAINTTGKPTPLNSAGIVRSAANNQKLWFADGTNYCYYDPSINTVVSWVASAGVLPVDSTGFAPRLICTWRGRTVVSGLLNDPQNWFMSAVNDPTNWNYFPDPIVQTQAVAGNNSPLGLVGDVVNVLIPYTDDILIFGGDHTIYQMNGDPMSGGNINLISDTIGMAWGNPWCKGPDGTLYFFSNRNSVFMMTPGQAMPQRISQPIEQLLVNIDTGSNTIRMVWDERFQGLHVFVTPTGTQATTTHYFYEARTGGWWQDQFAQNAMNPLAVTVFDGNLANDRRPLIGSWDGYVRFIDPDAEDDDSIPIASSVMIGPLLTSGMDDVILKDLQALMGAGAGMVTYKVYVGTTPEVALASQPVAQGVWYAGLNTLSFVRRSGQAVYVQINGLSAWAMESIRARFMLGGKVRQRYNR